MRAAYGELYELKKAGQLFAEDDYIDVSRYSTQQSRSYKRPLPEASIQRLFFARATLAMLH